MKVFQAAIVTLVTAVLFLVTGTARADDGDDRPFVRYPDAPPKVSERAHFVVYIDDHFTTQERFVITRGVHEWVRATNGMITTEERSGWTSDQEMRDRPEKGKCTRSIHIARANHDYPTVAEEERKKGSLNGMAYGDCQAKFIIMVMDRIDGDMWLLKQVTTHEMGHILGLKHIPVPFRSVMYPNDGNTCECVTELDLQQLCDDDKWNCDAVKLAPCVPIVPKKSP